MIRRNPDGSLTVGILYEDKKVEPFPKSGSTVIEEKQSAIEKNPQTKKRGRPKKS